MIHPRIPCAPPRSSTVSATPRLRRRSAAAALALLMLLPCGCLTARHRPVTPSEPTWVAVGITPSLAWATLAQDGRPIATYSLPHISHVVGKVMEQTVADTVVVVVVVGVAALGAYSGTDPFTAIVGLTSVISGGGPPKGLPPGIVPESSLNVFLICRDAASGDLVERQRLGQGLRTTLPIPLYPGQQGRLSLEIDDEVRVVAIPLAVIQASPGRRVEISVRTAPEPVAAARPPSAPAP